MTMWKSPRQPPWLLACSTTVEDVSLKPTSRLKVRVGMTGNSPTGAPHSVHLGLSVSCLWFSKQRYQIRRLLVVCGAWWIVAGRRVGVNRRIALCVEVESRAAKNQVAFECTC